MKAIILTGFILIVGYLLAVQFDNARASSLKADIDRVNLENQEREVLLHYSQVMTNNPKEICPSLQALRANRLGEVSRLDTEIADYQRSNLFNQDYLDLSNTYFVGSVDLLVTGEENARLCGNREYPVILFYRYSPDCPDCRAMGPVLNEVANRCANARTYAFPIDTDNQVVLALVNRYKANVSAAPAVSINDGELSVGVQSANSIIAKLKAQGATCS